MNPEKPFKYLLVGNPNCGKSTLFNHLTGLNQKTGNFHGVTVEKKIGFIPTSETDVEIWDLPGSFSLEGSSEDRIVTSQEILNRNPQDRIIFVMDSLQMERSMQFLTSIIDTGAKVIVVLTMKDILLRRKIEIDVKQIQNEFGVQFHLINSKSNDDIHSLQKILFDPNNFSEGKRIWKWQNREENILNGIITKLNISKDKDYQQKAFAIQEALKEIYEQKESSFLNLFPESTKQLLISSYQKGKFSTQEELIAKSIAIKKMLSKSIIGSNEKTKVINKVDRVFLHPFFGLLSFFLIIGIVFQFLFSWSEVPMNLIESGIGLIQSFLIILLPKGSLTDLLLEGILGGVGSVLVFIPQISLLFFFIGIMEESGYMARVSFVMDKIMGRFGLSGKSFIPLLSSAACAVPAIMGTRTIENKNDRITTILIAPLIMCSARYPVYILVIGTVFTSEKVIGIFNLQGFILFLLFLLGLFTSLAFGLFFKKTIFRSTASYFIMELPDYKLPSIVSILNNVILKVTAFVKNAGQIILYISVLLWFVSYYPIQTNKNGEVVSDIQESYVAGFGHAIEPLIQPLGYDWKIGVALITSFAAREVMVSTLAILYGVEEGNEESPSLREAMKKDVYVDGTPIWTPLTGFSILIFFAYASQCMSTLAVVKKETNSYIWPIFQFVYMTCLAYFSAFLVYQVGGILGF
jgi:ferrous iron transport protein B